VSARVLWPYAAWGMTAAEIVAASGGSAQALHGDDQDDRSGPGFTTLAIAEIEIGAFAFDVSFRAAAGGTTLRTVRLELREPEQYDALRAELTAEHGDGEPVPPEGEAPIDAVRWTTPTETIVLRRLVWPMDLGVEVVVDYEAPSASA
jgi:hypothetical protein